MGSLSAMKRGGKERYFKVKLKICSEGIEGRVPYKGKIRRRNLPINWWNKSWNGLLPEQKISKLYKRRKNGDDYRFWIERISSHDVIITQRSSELFTIILRNFKIEISQKFLRDFYIWNMKNINNHLIFISIFTFCSN